jgi:DNA-binding FadR family transcriptional regulator
MTAPFARNLTQQFAEFLGVRIVKGEFKEGDVVTAGSLQEEYGVSRTVVREAFQILQSKGLIQPRTKTGTIVLGRWSWNLLDADVIAWYNTAGVGVQLVKKLAEVRQSYEPWAARAAAQRRTADDLKKIRAAYELMISSTSADSDPSASVSADLAFHQAILAATDNEIMVHLGLLIQPVLQIRDEMALHHNFNTDFLEDHRAVLEAIEEEQPDLAEQAMKGLLRRSAQDTAKFEGNEDEWESTLLQ